MSRVHGAGPGRNRAACGSCAPRGIKVDPLGPHAWVQTCVPHAWCRHMCLMRGCRHVCLMRGCRHVCLMRWCLMRGCLMRGCRHVCRLRGMSQGQGGVCWGDAVMQAVILGVC